MKENHSTRLFSHRTNALEQPKDYQIHLSRKSISQISTIANNLNTTNVNVLVLIWGKLVSVLSHSNSVSTIIQHQNNSLFYDLNYDKKTTIQAALTAIPQWIETPPNQHNHSYPQDILQIDKNTSTLTIKNTLLPEYQLRLIEQSFLNILDNLKTLTQKLSDISLLPTNNTFTESIGTKYQDYYTQDIIERLEISFQNSKQQIALIHINNQDQRSVYTYDNIRKTSNKIANSLSLSKDIKSGDIVACCLHSGIEMLCTIIALWKLNAIYVPVDPELPNTVISEQFSAINADRKIKLILASNQTIKEKFSHPDFETTHAISLDELQYRCYAAKRDYLKIDLDNPACIFFTSGSTGKPKGIQQHHRQHLNSLLGMRDSLHLPNNPIWLALANNTFDISILELLLPLILGHQVITVDRVIAKDPAQLIKIIRNEEVGVIEATPITWHLLCQAGWKRQAHPQLKLLCGGEEITRETAEKIAPFYHVYGTTETTTWSTIHYIENPSASMYIPAGIPLPNTTVTILDQNDLPVPVGFPGMIFISGDGVCQYLQQDLTQQKFLQMNNRVLYNTGDFGMWLLNHKHNPEIIVIGRRDTEIKIHGHRIDLKYIEQVISQQPKISSCAVAHTQTEIHQTQLVAFLVLKPNCLFSENHFAQTLEKHLPLFMRPRQIEVIEKLPISINGKVNYKELRARLQNPSKHIIIRDPHDFLINMITPLTNDPIEEKHFTKDLGLDSLQLLQFSNWLRERYGVEIGYSELVTTVGNLQTLRSRLEKSIIRPNKKVFSIEPTSHNEGRQSSAQERLFHYAKKYPDLLTYNVPIVWKILGNLNIPALEFAINQIIDRHAILNTVFYLSHEQFMQKILSSRPHLTLSTKLIDNLLQNYKTPLAGIANNHFELEKTPAFRVELLKDTLQNHYILILCFHHIILDGQSEKIFYTELKEFYSTFQNNEKTPNLPKLSIRYLDYANAETEWLKSNHLMQDAKQYWSSRMQNLPCLRLPFDAFPTGTEKIDGSSVNFSIPNEFANAWKNFATNNNASFFSLLYTLFLILMHRYTEDEDIAMSIATNNRANPQTENLLGHFVNMVVIRNEINAKTTFGPLLKAVMQNIEEAQKYQILPYQEIAGYINKNNSKPPEVALVYVPDATLQLPDIDITPIPVLAKHAKLPLIIHFIQHTADITITLEYMQSHFSEKSMETLLSNYAQLLKNLSTCLIQDKNGEKFLTSKILDIDFMPNNQLSNFPLQTQHTSCTILYYFDRTVKNYPQAIALDDNIIQLNFQELDKASNCIANFLHQKYSTKIIALFIGKQILTYQCILGILKSGSAYVLIHPDLSQEQILNIIQESQAAVILTDSTGKEKLTQFSVKIEAIDIGENLHSNQLELGKPALTIDSSQLAYIKFTSGTTGRPKGVKITHSVASACMDYAEFNAIKPKQKVLAVASLAFDAFEIEFFSAIFQGATLCLPPIETMMVGDALLTALEKFAITHAFITPSVLAATEAKLLPHLTTVITAGEVCSEITANRWCQNRQLNIFYGLTETNISLTRFHYNPKQRISACIGTPREGVMLLIVDKQGRLVPPGIPGELCVAGNIAQDFTNSEIEKERFITITLDQNSTIRAIKTGDRIYLGPDNCFYFLGRYDNQIKINGRRVEIGDIQKTIKDLPEVEDVVVTYTHPDSPQMLIAYIIPKQKPLIIPLYVKSIQTKLANRLPAFMLPKLYQIVDAFPITLSGKLDLGRLPVPKPIANSSINRASTPTEITLSELAAQCMEISENENQIDVDTSLSSQGLESIKTVLLLDKIKQTFPCIDNQHGLNFIFQHNTITALATEIDKLQETTNISTNPHHTFYKNNENNESSHYFTIGTPPNKNQ